MSIKNKENIAPVPNPPELLLTEDGSHTLLSQQHGVTYHSRYGAIMETQHVFINSALRYKAVISKKLDILEIGFGTGLNAFMSCLEATRRNLKLSYTGVEAFPLSEAQTSQLNYAQLLEKPESEGLFRELHAQSWGKPYKLRPNFKLFKLKERFENLQFNNTFDIIYFDAFAPTAQPELWEEPLLQSMFQALRPEGILVTYCAKGIVKRRFKGIGFQLETLKGPPGKREMIRVTKPLK